MKRSSRSRPSPTAAVPVRPIQTPGDSLLLAALTAVRNGDFAARLPTDGRRISPEIAAAFNEVVLLNHGLTDELTGLGTVVGKQGRLSRRAALGGMRGGWADSIEAVNGLVADLVQPMNEISRVIDSVERGDLSHGMALDVEGRPLKGESLRMAKAVNRMVDHLGTFASEVTRVAHEVGTEGKLGGQARVKGASGAWKDLADNVNAMAASVTDRVRSIREVTTAVTKGDLRKKITVEMRGEMAELKETINTMVDQLRAIASEVTRVAREVSTEGRLGGQAHVEGVGGTWNELTESVNSMADNLTSQVRNIAEVTTAVAKGDLTKKITVDVRGEFLQLKGTINTMVDQLNSFASEVTRVAREVGTEGNLGGQAEVHGAAGVWKELTDNVNTMAENVTSQVRGIARVVTAVANGDLNRKLVLEAKGEIAVLAVTIDEMIDQLNAFASEVTRVAREVGVEGRLGGQAHVPGAAGTWKDLTHNVNQLAANLTNQVRAIGAVATAVTHGDLTPQITVAASGEVASLKDAINEMIRNLKETTRKNQEQDWLNSNLARIALMLQGQRDAEAVSHMILSELANLAAAQHGAFFVLEARGEPRFTLRASYASTERKAGSNSFRMGEGLVGQAALDKQTILVTDVPDGYARISSGLGEGTPLNVIVLPVLFEGEVNAVIELASFNPFNDVQRVFLAQLGESLGIVLNTIASMERTEELLSQSQTMTERLQAQQEQLQESNKELEDRARRLTEQKAEVESNKSEIELAKLALEVKAEQLALASRYKSEFLANMSHELRTPLNSLLMLARLLADNTDGKLGPKQVQYARTVHSSGVDLLTLINEILDLAKIESGTIAVDVEHVYFDDLRDFVETTFREIAEAQNLDFEVRVDPALPPTLSTDVQRLKQVLRNLLSNAFKFTEKGLVQFSIRDVTGGWSVDRVELNEADAVVAFEVKDTGIGIPADKQDIVFEAFQQADGTTSRKYGGTGLGLSISREIAHLLGGDLQLASGPGKGSTFTFYVPLAFAPTTRRARHSSAAVDAAAVVRLVAEGGAAALVAPMAARAEASSGTGPAATLGLADDRGAIGPTDKVLLIVEDDLAFAGVLLHLAREQGFKGVVAIDAASGLSLARKLRPAAITLDLILPGGDGWTVLDRLKHDPGTRHIPVHVISAADRAGRASRLGAFACLAKPVTAADVHAALSGIRLFIERDVRRLLLIEDDERQRTALIELIGSGDVVTVGIGTGKEALELLGREPFDCAVLDLGLPDMDGLTLLEHIKALPGLKDLPIIVYTSRDLTRKQETRLGKLPDSIILRDVSSPERILAETALFLHRVEANLPEAKRLLIERAYAEDSMLAGRKALIVDDDVRNVFALTCLLEQSRMDVVSASDGRQALDMLATDMRVHVILMDIMMPRMDGYATIRAIRAMEAIANVPIIVVTAKAMKGDREKSLEAGASGYITKPVDPAELQSLLRVCLQRAPTVAPGPSRPPLEGSREKKASESS